jgi:putative nucleotidyltransferase with HDIG domain
VTREDLALHIIRSLRDAGHQALLVGGCVRDRLLGIAPKDFDVGTDATPDEITACFPNAQLVGAHFGVVLVRGPQDTQVEVATFRSESGYFDGRRPGHVHFETDPALDAQRRDFTVNGLMQDPFSGQVFDFVGGQPDLAARTIRAIGDPAQRFAEDYLRMLRAVRFAARLGFSLEPRTLASIRAQAHSINRISAERIRDELARILTEGQARQGFELLDASALLPHILPEVKALQGVAQPPEFHPEGDVWNHVLLMLAALEQPTLTLALGALLHDVGKPPTFTVSDRIRFNGHAETGAAMTAKILDRLRFPQDQVQQVTSLVAHHMRFKDVQHMRLSTLKRFLSLPHFDEHLELHRLDCLASNGYTAGYDFVLEKLREFKQEELHPPPLVTGRDLIQAGYAPGPAFRRALDAVETAQLEGEVQTRQDALMLARKVLDSASK